LFQRSAFDQLVNFPTLCDERIGIILIAEGEAVQLRGAPAEAEKNHRARPALYEHPVAT
jgi:hypothetical protein